MNVLKMCGLKARKIVSSPKQIRLVWGKQGVRNLKRQPRSWENILQRAELLKGAKPQI